MLRCAAALWLCGAAAAAPTPYIATTLQLGAISDSIAWGPGDHLAIAQRGVPFDVYSEGALMQPLESVTTRTRMVAWGPDGSLLTVSFTHEVHFWEFDAQTGARATAKPAFLEDRNVRQACWSPNGKHFAAIECSADCRSDDFFLRVWTRKGPSFELQSVRLRPRLAVTGVYVLVWSLDSRYLAYAEERGNDNDVVSVRDVSAWDVTARYIVAGVCNAIACAPDGSSVAIAATAGFGVYGGLSPWVTDGEAEHVVWSPDGVYLAVGRPRQSVRGRAKRAIILSSANGAHLAEVWDTGGVRGVLRAIAWGPSGLALAGGASSDEEGGESGLGTQLNVVQWGVVLTPRDDAGVCADRRKARALVTLQSPPVANVTVRVAAAGAVNQRRVTVSVVLTVDTWLSGEVVEVDVEDPLSLMLCATIESSDVLYAAAAELCTNACTEGFDETALSVIGAIPAAMESFHRARTAAVIAGVVGAFGMGSGMPTRLTMAVYLCDPDSPSPPGAVGYSDAFLLSPLGLTVGGSEALGTLAGNFALITGVCLVAGVVVASRQRLRCWRRETTPPPEPQDEPWATDKAFAAYCSIMVFLMLYQGTTTAALFVMLNAGTALVSLTGFAGSAVCAAVPVYLSHRVYKHVPSRLSLVGDAETTTRGALPTFLIGTEEWKRRPSAAFLVPLVYPYTHNRFWFWVFDLSATVAVSAIHVSSPAGQSGCRTQFLGYGILFTLMVAVMAAMQPHRLLRYRIIELFSLTMQAAAAFIVYAGYGRAETEDPDTAKYFTVAGALFVVAAYPLTLNAVITVSALLWSHATGRHEAHDECPYVFCTSGDRISQDDEMTTSGGSSYMRAQLPPCDTFMTPPGPANLPTFGSLARSTSELTPKRGGSVRTRCETSPRTLRTTGRVPNLTGGVSKGSGLPPLPRTYSRSGSVGPTSAPSALTINIATGLPTAEGGSHPLLSPTTPRRGAPVSPILHFAHSPTRAEAMRRTAVATLTPGPTPITSPPQSACLDATAQQMVMPTALLRGGSQGLETSL